MAVCRCCFFQLAVVDIVIALLLILVCHVTAALPAVFFGVVLLALLSLFFLILLCLFFSCPYSDSYSSSCHPILVLISSNINNVY